ncbi:MAG: tetratricopeptide repeat protein [Anaerolineae bacterium]
MKNWHAKAMLAALHFKARRFDDAERVFEEAVRFNKKEAMLWAAYAWCESKRQEPLQGDRRHAAGRQGHAGRSGPEGQPVGPPAGQADADERLHPEWWALHLERPPAKVLMADQRSDPRVRQLRRMRP